MKDKVDVLVIGAGASGLGAAAWLKEAGADFMVVEANKELPLNLHNGVHYLHEIPEVPFRTDLKEITLTDGIVYEGKIRHTPNLEHSLQYSEKVREIQHPSSIMSVGKRKKVYMPKNNSVNSLLEKCYDFAGHNNFHFGVWLKEIDTENKIAIFQQMTGDETYEVVEVKYEHLISAVPLDKFRDIIRDDFAKDLVLGCAPVYIANYQLEKIVPNWMINLYIPDPITQIYRASVLNGICSVESVEELSEEELRDPIKYLSMFHFKNVKPERFTWNTGKVISISMDDRRKLVKDLKELNIYQIGRFGLWNRKLLIDSSINQAKSVVDYISNGLPGVESWNKTTWTELENLLAK